MTDRQTDRWTRGDATAGADPRKTDAERTTGDGARDVLQREALTHAQEPTGGLGATSDAPGRDLDDLLEGRGEPVGDVAQGDLPQADLPELVGQVPADPPPADQPAARADDR